MAWMLRQHKWLDQENEEENFQTTIVLYSGDQEPSSEIVIPPELDPSDETHLCIHFPTWINIVVYYDHPSVPQFVKIVQNLFG